jgi:xanthine dehydrogenase accessory factor
MKNIYLNVLDEISKNASLVLATVTRASGSTPRKPGSSALFGKKGLIAGTIGGGVVEGSVQQLATEAFKTGRPCLTHFNLAYGISRKEEAICGGEVSVLIDANLRNSIGIFEQMKQSISAGIPGVLVTMVTVHTEDSVLINRYWITKESLQVLPEEFHLIIKPVADSMILKGDPYDYREMELSIPGEEPASLFFLEPMFPSPKLIIAGAGHIGKALAHLGAMLGFEVTVIDDRPEFADKSNIPDADQIIVSDIGDALRNLNKDSSTFVVIVTRGHKDDAAALKPCIGTDLAYLGMIGSRTKVAQMRTEFIGNGWATSEQWDKIDAPVGLEINSHTVEEIAISIAAQLVLVRNSK